MADDTKEKDCAVMGDGPDARKVVEAVCGVMATRHAVQWLLRKEGERK